MRTLALLLADVHLSWRPPVARSVEPDWLEAQARILRQVGDLVAEHYCPILCAGDVFHRYNPPPALINFAIRELPKIIAVPGQHDLPNHRLEDVERSAFWTLVEVGRIRQCKEPVYSYKTEEGISMALSPFPWGKEIKPVEKCRWCGERHLGGPERCEEKIVHIALCHRYVARTLAEAHPGAPPSARASSLREQLEGYDVAAFGDNHKPFERQVGDCLVYNCGALIPRTIAEREHRPSVGLLMEDGSVQRHYLDTSEDKWEERPGDEPADSELVRGLAEFRRELSELSIEEVDYKGAVRRWAQREETPEAVREVLLRSVE